MVLRIIEMVIANIFVTVVTIRLFRALRSGVRHLDLAIFGFLWIYTATLYAMILGILGLLESHRIAAISIIGLGLLAVPAREGLKQRISRPGAWLKSAFIDPLGSVFSSFPA